MPVIFADTSALVKFYYPEKDSDRVEELFLRAKLIYISSLTTVELASALMKKVRRKELTKTQETLIWNAFLDDLQTSRMELVYLDERHFSKASNIVREFGAKFGIKTLDALQLATANGLDNVGFLCSDRALLDLAKEIGMQVIDA